MPVFSRRHLVPAHNPVSDWQSFCPLANPQQHMLKIASVRSYTTKRESGEVDVLNNPVRLLLKEHKMGVNGRNNNPDNTHKAPPKLYHSQLAQQSINGQTCY